jgi:hypothetical protein
MFTKSIIQQALEVEQAKYDFLSSIENLMEKYNIEDSVFIYKNGAMREVVEGYFVTDGEFTNLNEAVSTCDINTMGIRIMGNQFQVGTVHSKISECASDKKVFDLMRLETVR